MALLRAKLSEMTCRYDAKKTIKLYESVFDLNSESEEAHFRLARYYDGMIKIVKEDCKGYV